MATVEAKLSYFQERLNIIKRFIDARRLLVVFAGVVLLLLLSIFVVLCWVLQCV